MKNRISGMLMETGVSYEKLRLHRKGYFDQLMKSNEEVSDSIRPLLKLCREQIDRCRRNRTECAVPFAQRAVRSALGRARRSARRAALEPHQAASLAE